MARTKSNAIQLQVPWKRVVNVVGPAGTVTASGTAYFNLPSTANTTITVTKVRADTNLVISLDASFYLTTSVDRIYFGVNIGGTDYDVTRRYVNEIAEYKQASGALEIPGLAAGSYTCTVRSKLGGTGVYNIDISGCTIMTVEEVKTS